MDFVLKDPAYNLFLIGDVEHFGYDKEFQELWGQFEGRRLIAVLLRYRSNFVMYAPGPHDSAEFSRVLNSSEKFSGLSGKPETLELYTHIISFQTKRLLFFAELDPRLFEPVRKKRDTVEKATADDAEAVFTLRVQIPEFEDFQGEISGFRTRLESGLGRTLFIKDGNSVISTASTVAESSIAAMIGGVMTHPHHRRGGNASVCLSSICEELLAEKKTVCLFYDNPDAGSIYKKIGFRDIGRWLMVSK